MSDASSKQPGSIWRRRRSRLPAAFAALVALLLCLFCCGMPKASAAATPSVRISLDSNIPAVSASGKSVEISGTLTNTGSTEISKPVVHVGLSDRLLDTRASADAWIAGQLNWQLHQVASAEATAITPGSVTPFTVTIAGSKLDYAYALASLPMQVTVTDGATGSTVNGSARSSLHLQNGAVASPLRVSVVIPLTLPADPDLFGPSGAARAAAWEQAIGPDSTVQRTIDAFAGQPVIFAVDPELLDPPAAADDNVPAPPPPSTSSSPSPDTSIASSDTSAPTSHPTSTDSATTSPTRTSGATGSAGTATGGPSDSNSSSPSSTPTQTPTTPAGREATAVASLKDHLSSLTSGQSVWWLPADDPDLTALRTQSKAGAALLARDLTRPLPDLAKTLGSTRAIWPVGDLSAAAVTADSKQLAAANAGSNSVAILPGRSIAPQAATSATHRAPGSVLTYDEDLSRIFSAPTTSPGVQSGQLLTALLAAYQVSPGTPRSLALVAPRTGGANPTQLAAQLSALRAARWVSVQTGAQTESALQKAPATTLLGTPSKGTPFPQVTAQAVSDQVLDGLATSRSRLSALQSVMVGGDKVLPARATALDIVGSTRWRGAPAKLEAVAGRDDAAVAAMLAKLSIRSSTINFFADSGDISVTVANGLNRPVHGLQLRLRPRKYQIKVTDSVERVDVEAGARSTTHFHIKAVGAGTVPIDAMLSAPDGTSLSVSDAPSQLKINVHPTSGWIMWVLGALAALILFFGLWRAARRGPRAASEPTPAGEPTPDEAIVDAGRGSSPPTDDHDEGR